MVKLQNLTRMENYLVKKDNVSVIDSIKLKFDALTENPEHFFLEVSGKATDYESVTKTLHDISKCNQSQKTSKSKFLPKLLTNGFDDEQIWQQLELKSKSTLANIGNDVFKLDFNDLLSRTDIREKSDEETNVEAENVSETSSSDDYNDMHEMPENDEFLSDEDDGLDDDHDEDDDLDDDHDEDNETLGTALPGKNVKLHKTANIEDDSDNGYEKLPKKQKDSKKSKNKSIVDDQFFKLSSMEQFLRLEDLKDEKLRDGDLEQSDDDDEEKEEIDLFQDIPSDEIDDSEEEIEDENDLKKSSSKDLMYDDFFDAPESGDESVTLSRQYSGPEEGDGEFSNEDEDMDDESMQQETVKSKFISSNDEQQISKTPFELQQDEINKQIADYEDTLVKKREWQLTGEVDASSRPADALLDMQTDFDMNAKPVIVQDQSLCEKLENLIKMTIKNKSYSDGVKQYKTDKDVIAYKKETILEQTKSKKSLAQEYEDIYLKKQAGQEEEENPKHKEINKLMDSLFPELHALFSHIPKPAIPDIKIVSNLPAITVEEVAPTSVSDVTLLAPEEVKRRTGLVKGKTERTDVDRKRERRKKKVHQKMLQKKRENDVAEGKPLSAKAKKQEKLDILKKLKQHTNTKIAKMDGEKIKSSKDFFERLQEAVSSKVNKEQMKNNKKKRKT